MLHLLAQRADASPSGSVPICGVPDEESRGAAFLASLGGPADADAGVLHEQLAARLRAMLH